jgi:molybdopterin converting factor small subunit
VRIRVVITGRGYHTAAGVPEAVELPDGASVEDALDAVSRHLPEGQSLPASCLVAVNGRHLGTIAGHRSVVLAEEDELTLIAPVAGG